LLRKVTNKNHNLAIFPERDTGLEPVTPSLGSLFCMSDRVRLWQRMPLDSR
jgi:hypothetical protein